VSKVSKFPKHLGRARAGAHLGKLLTLLTRLLTRWALEVEKQRLMATTENAAWIGWFRAPGGTWREVCRGTTEREVWDKLLDLAKAGDKLVLRSGRFPWDRSRQPGLFT
jgi:hypothetical protein